MCAQPTLTGKKKVQAVREAVSFQKVHFCTLFNPEECTSKVHFSTEIVHNSTFYKGTTLVIAFVP